MNEGTNNLNSIFYNHNNEIAFRLYEKHSERFNALQLPKGIVSTVTNSASEEFNFSVLTQNMQLKRMEQYIKNNIKRAETNLVVGGYIVFKPYIKNGKIGVALYNSRDAAPFYNEYGELTKVYFKSDIRISEYESYTFVELHTYDEAKREYRIDNYLYSSPNTDWNRKYRINNQMVGSRVPLSKCIETANLDDYYVIEDVDRHLCSVVSLDNTVRYNKGESLYGSSINLIHDAELAYDGLIWEMEGGQLAVDCPDDMFIPRGKSREGTYVIPQGKDRLFRHFAGARQESMEMKVFNPNLRVDSYSSGLNEILRKIELNCGLYYGALSNVSETQKTASEVVSSKQRFYVLVMGIKNKMKTGIGDVIHSCATLYNLFLPDFLKENIEITWEIGDSVIDLIVPGTN